MKQRPQDGRGASRGVQGGRRQNQNTKPCPKGGKGQGHGKGKNR